MLSSCKYLYGICLQRIWRSDFLGLKTYNYWYQYRYLQNNGNHGSQGVGIVFC